MLFFVVDDNEQKQIVRLRAKIDTQLFIDILAWFVKESGIQVIVIL
jgi:hypothetical protein